WTDIYAFAAVLYRVLAGTIPMSSPDRRNNDRLMIPARVAEKLPAYVIDALINALQIMPVDRTRTAEQLRAELSASPSFVENYQDRNTAVVNAPPKKQAEDNIYDARDDREYDDEDDNGKRSSGGGGKKLILGIILGIFLAFAGLGVFMFYTQNGGIINPTPTTAPHITTAAAETTANDAFPVVPLFIGRNDQDVKNDAVLMGKFDIEFKEQSSVEFPKGIIIEQDIAPNDIVSKGTKIILTVSSGLPKVIVPPLAGHDYNEAAEALTALGLYCIPAEKVNDGSNIGGAIIDTIPAEGTVLEQGADIFINFWEYINGEPKPTAAPKAPVEE
ncbi:MAG: PASTA domain-containing protein, partial [Oscillospiraceae bacterium]|nr:PASTA domain-containing protein [Oscillospiraceae bacterium]